MLYIPLYRHPPLLLPLQEAQEHLPKKFLATIPTRNVHFLQLLRVPQIIQQFRGNLRSSEATQIFAHFFPQVFLD